MNPPAGKSSLETISNSGSRLEAELDQQLRSLEAALENDPDSPHVGRAVELAREQREMVGSLVTQALEHETAGRLDQALERWRTLGTVHPAHDEIAGQIERLQQRLQGAPQTSPSAPEPGNGANEPTRAFAAAPATGRRVGGLGKSLAERVRRANLPRRGLEAVRAVRERLPMAARSMAEAIGWMQAHVDSAQGRTPAPADIAAKDPKKRFAAKPILFLGGGVAVALLLAVIVGRREQQPPGPPPSVQQVSIQVAPAEAQIFIDGRPCGYGSCQAPLEAGMHEISGRLAGYAAMRHSVAVEPGDAGQEQSVRLALDPLTPELELTTDLERGQVLLDGELAGTIEEGVVRIEDLPFGEHEIRFAGGGLSMTLRYRAEPGKPLELIGPPAASELKVAVAAGLADQVRLYTASSTASVSFDGGEEQDVGEAGFQPAVIAVGAHEAAFSDGSSVGFEIGMRPMLVASLTSDRNVGALRVLSEVDGATVYLNGKAYRRKTSRGGLLVYLRPGTYKVRVSKEGFLAPAEQTAKIVKGRRARLEMPLEAEPQAATLVVSGGIPGSEVLLDGRSAGSVRADGTFRLGGVEPGEHAIELRRDGYDAKKSRRDFPAQAEVTVDGGLKQVLGVLKIRVSPAGVRATLTLRREGDASSRPITERELRLPPGIYTVTAEAPQYKEYAATVRVEPRGEKTASLTLEKIARAAPRPRDLLPALGRLGWSLQGDLRVIAGAGFTVAPAGPGPGVYRFSIRRQRGRLYWAANYRNERNHVLYQIRKSGLVRIVVADGEKGPETERRFSVDLGQLLTFRLDVRADRIVVSLFDGSGWVEVDRFEGESLAGRFAFYTGRSRLLGRVDQVGVKAFSFTPAE